MVYDLGINPSKEKRMSRLQLPGDMDRQAAMLRAQAEAQQAHFFNMHMMIASNFMAKHSTPRMDAKNLEHIADKAHLAATILLAKYGVQFRQVGQPQEPVEANANDSSGL